MPLNCFRMHVARTHNLSNRQLSVTEREHKRDGVASSSSIADNITLILHATLHIVSCILS